MKSATRRDHMALSFPQRLPLAQIPTPLQSLDRLSEYLGGPRIWIKRDDLTGSTLSGNKVRKLEFVVAQARKEGCDTLITCGGLQSNHCRATAAVGAQLGMSVHLILRGQQPADFDGNLLLDYLCGAQVSCYRPTEYRQRLPELFEHWGEHYRSRGSSPFYIPTGASDEIGVWGYVAACQELSDDFAAHSIQPNYLIVATGSGGTQAGLTVGCRLFNLPCTVIGMAVCDDEQYFLNKVSQDLSAWQRRYQVDCDLKTLSINVNANYIGPGYAQATAEIFSSIKLLAKLEGMVLDPVYTGKAMHGLIEEIRKGSFAGENDIVFVHTGGIFGLFPYREQLSLS